VEGLRKNHNKMHQDIVEYKGEVTSVAKMFVKSVMEKKFSTQFISYLQEEQDMPL
jgi:uncharacterized coiled-coil DUF342 family protein